MPHLHPRLLTTVLSAILSASAQPSPGAGNRPRSIVFRRVQPDAGGHFAIHIECLPNAGCTLFTEFLCGQLLSRGQDVACFPDIYDCTTMVPKRANETLPRGHHYVAKSKLWPAFSDFKGTPREAPDFIEPGSHVLREWRELGRTVNILFMRDPLQNMLSLRSKLFCAACGGMRARFAAADRLFARTYEARDASTYWDAILFAEDMANPVALLATLAELLGPEALGQKPVGIAKFAAVWYGYKSKSMAANNAALGYRWSGFLPVNGSTSGRYGIGGVSYRFGTGNAELIKAPSKPFYHHRRRPATIGDQLLARALAPRLAAAYERTWAEADGAGAQRADLAGEERLLAGALGQHRCHGCRKGSCPRNVSAIVGPSPAMFGRPLLRRPRDLRTYYPTLAGPPIVPVSGPKMRGTAEIGGSAAAGAHVERLLYALGHPLPGDATFEYAPPSHH